MSHFKSRNNLPFKLICIMTIINWGIWHINAVKVSINWGTCFNQKLYIYLLIIWTDRQEAAQKSLNYYDYHCTSYCICDIILPKQIIALIWFTGRYNQCTILSLVLFKANYVYVIDATTVFSKLISFVEMIMFIMILNCYKNLLIHTKLFHIQDVWFTTLLLHVCNAAARRTCK